MTLVISKALVELSSELIIRLVKGQLAIDFPFEARS
jgi:hypothetical protein